MDNVTLPYYESGHIKYVTRLRTLELESTTVLFLNIQECLNGVVYNSMILKRNVESVSLFIYSLDVVRSRPICC